jgi:hypothetical protein
VRRTIVRWAGLVAVATAAGTAVVLVAGLGGEKPTAGRAPGGRPAGPCAAVAREARSATAAEMAVLYVRERVLRLGDPRCRQLLETAAFRRRYPQIDRYETAKPRQVRARITNRVDLVDQNGSWVTLDGPDAPELTYEIVLVRRDGRWLVDYWARAVGF